MLTYIIASGGAGIAYGLDNVVTQRLDMFMVRVTVGFVMWVIVDFCVCGILGERVNHVLGVTGMGHDVSIHRVWNGGAHAEVPGQTLSNALAAVFINSRPLCRVP